MKRRKFLQLLGLSAVAAPVAASLRPNNDGITIKEEIVSYGDSIIHDEPKGYLYQNNDIPVITFTATNNNGTTWSAEGLPKGLTLNSKTGLISGTPV